MLEAFLAAFMGQHTVDFFDHVLGGEDHLHWHEPDWSDGHEHDDEFGEDLF